MPALRARFRLPACPGAPARAPRLPPLRPRHLLLAALASAAAFAAPATAEPVRGGVPIRMDEREVRAAGTELARVEPEAGTAEVSFPGVAAVPPQQLRVVAAPAAGLVEAMLVAPDERVFGGQPIAQLRSTELVEVQRAFLEALTRDALAREKLSRDEALFRERIIAERRLLTARAEAEAARATLDERRQMLALVGMTEGEQRALRERRQIAPALTVVAPVAGVVLQRQATPGERVVQSAPLFTIAQIDPLWLNLQVPLATVSALEPGARVSLPAQGLEGAVLRVGQSADPATQSVAVVAEVRAPAGRLRPGQAVTVAVAVRPNGVPQWRVPAAAVVRHRERSWVFLRASEGFVARPVTVIVESAQTASVRAELAPGDRVAVRGVLPLLAALSASGGD